MKNTIFFLNFLTNQREIIWCLTLKLNCSTLLEFEQGKSWHALHCPRKIIFKNIEYYIKNFIFKLLYSGLFSVTISARLLYYVVQWLNDNIVILTYPVCYGTSFYMSWLGIYFERFKCLSLVLMGFFYPGNLPLFYRSRWNREQRIPYLWVS